MTLYIKDVKDNIERHKSIEFNSLAFWRAIICELFGTLFLLFIGLSPLVNPAYEYPWNDVLSCICFSSVIFALVHIIGPVSGCNVNPIVTLALVLVRRLHPLKGLMYFVAQLTGAVIGCALVCLLSPFGFVEATEHAMTAINWDTSPVQAMGIEAVASALLVLLVLVVSDPNEEKEFEGFPSIGLGFTLLGCYFATIPSGASLNPARSFAPALLGLKFKHHWVYWAGPIIGSLIAVASFQLLLTKGNPAKCKSNTSLKLSSGERDSQGEEGNSPVRRIRPEA